MIYLPMTIISLFLTGSLLAQSAEQLEFFEKKVRPILATNCYSCHGPKQQMAGLNFSTAAGFEQVIVKANSAQSRLYQAISYTEKIKMPPPGKLVDHEIADLKAWIDMGAPDPRDGSAAKAYKTLTLEESKSFWSFQPPVKRTPVAG